MLDPAREGGKHGLEVGMTSSEIGKMKENITTAYSCVQSLVLMRIALVQSRWGDYVGLGDALGYASFLGSTVSRIGVFSSDQSLG